MTLIIRLKRRKNLDFFGYLFQVRSLISSLSDASTLVWHIGMCYCNFAPSHSCVFLFCLFVFGMSFGLG